jgi:hypothetical protein
LENLKGTAEEREAAVLAQRQKQIENTDESIKTQTATIQLQREAQKELQNMLHAGGLATSYFMMKLAEATKTEGAKLPNAAGTQGMNAQQLAAEVEKANKQMRSQGVGGVPGETEGKRADLQVEATGKKMEAPTETMIREKAMKELGVLVPEIRDATIQAIDELTAKIADTAAGAVRDGYIAAKKALQDRLNNLVLPPPPPPRSFVNPNDFSSQISAPKNQAFQSAASMKYKESVNPDLSQQLSGTAEDAKRAMTQFAGLPEKTTNQEIVASNTMLATKMDELIGLMRTSNGYQQKISQQAYA